MKNSPLCAITGLLAGVLACGSGKGAEDTGDASTGGTTGGTSTGDAPTTGTSDGTTDGETTGGLEGICPPGWELPASIVTQLQIEVPDASVGAFEPGQVYPDGSAAACVRWDGMKLAGVRLAIGPAVGDGPQGLLEAVVEDGEGEYGTSQWPPEPGAYEGLAAVFTLAATGEQPRTWNFETDEGIGMLWATWVPRRTGEHIILDAKLEMPATGGGAKVGFYVDAVIAPASAPTDAFCGGLDTPFKCMAVGCGGWLDTEVITDPTTCAREIGGACFAAIESTGDETYDSAFWREIDGVIHLRRVGGEACTNHSAEHPVGWAECSGGPGDPPACACVCAGGVCPGDAALATLDGCGLPKPCPDIDGWGEVDPQSHDCFFQALAAADPAALREHINQGDADWHDRVYLRGDGTASWLRGVCDVACIGSCEDRDWGSPRTCTLREPAFFTDCAATEDFDVLLDCADVKNWFVGCAVDVPATCP